MLCRVYRARPEQLGLHQVQRVRQLSAWTAETIGYGRHDAGVASSGWQEGTEQMTTDAGLPSVRESLQLALLAEPYGSALVDDLAEAAADHYALNYSRHPVPVLFTEVHATRTLLAGALAPGGASTDLQRQVGRSRPCWATSPSTWRIPPAPAPIWVPPSRTRTGAATPPWPLGRTGR